MRSAILEDVRRFAIRVLRVIRYPNTPHMLSRMVVNRMLSAFMKNGSEIAVAISPSAI